MGLILAALGLIGTASLLTMDFAFPSEIEATLTESFTPIQIKLLLLINPANLVIVAAIVGTFLFQKVNLRVPIEEKWVGINKESLDIYGTIRSGVVGGLYWKKGLESAFAVHIFTHVLLVIAENTIF